MRVATRAVLAEPCSGRISRERLSRPSDGSAIPSSDAAELAIDDIRRECPAFISIRPTVRRHIPSNPRSHRVADRIVVELDEGGTINGVLIDDVADLFALAEDTENGVLVALGSGHTVLLAGVE